ncbi:hypothetical protein [Rothia nasimurium]|uniref:hypothetical protein n=1 Tax=Rothia nasimurium TaxID=85336 RepID=UPI001F3DEDEA|nr:hypothetical protein [Rothia nasimurium]
MGKAEPLAIGEMPWRRIAISVSRALAIVGLVGTIVGGAVNGTHAGGGYLLGLVLIYLSFLVAIALVILAEKRSLKAAAISLMVAYPFKMLVLTLLLVYLPIPDSFRNGWFLAGAVSGLLIQLAMEVKIIAKQRILYFDSVG